MLGLGSYIFRWSVGHKGLVPALPMAHMDVLQVAAKHELGLVQFADNMPLDTLSSHQLCEMRRCARDLGIAIELGTQSFNADEVTRYIGYADVLNAKLLRVALDEPDANVPIKALAEKFHALLPMAKAAGVRIAIENHFNYPSQQLAALIDEIDDADVGVCLDVANSICAGEWPSETIERLAPYTINLHLKDYVIIPDPYGVGFAIHGIPLGQGRTDCRKVLDAMPGNREINVILEHWLPQEDDMRSARVKEHSWLQQSVEYARDRLGLR